MIVVIGVIPLIEFLIIQTISRPSYVKGYSFETQPDYRLGPVIGSRVRWVDPGQPKKNIFNSFLYNYNIFSMFF
jgi:hypothetical protein